MAVKNGLDFGGDIGRLIANTRGHGRAVIRSIDDLALTIRGSLELYAQQNAPWKDETGDARRLLEAVVERRGHVTSVTLTHGVFYGIYLELKQAGKWGIILRALQAHAPLWAAWCRTNGFR